MKLGELITTNTTYDSYFWVKCEQSGNQDITNNRTLINWSCGLYTTHKFYSNAIKMSAFSINGTQVYNGGTYSNFTAEGYQTIASGTLWINHNADGTKTFSISSFTGWLYSNYNYSSTGGSYDLTTIPRQATLTNVPNFTDEENLTINYTNPAGNSASLQVCIAIGWEPIIPYQTDISETATSYTFKFDDEKRKILRQKCTGNSLAVNVILATTIGGSTYHSLLPTTLSIVNGNPTFTENQITYTDTSAVKDITGNPLHIVQNQSNLEVTLKGATPNKEATISRYDITVNGVAKTTTTHGAVNFGKINTASNCDIVVVVTDSRGNTTTVKKQITVLEWSLPVVAVTLERLNNYEDESYLTVNASVSSVDGKNAPTISYRYCESGGAYGEAVSIDNKKKNTLSLDKNKAYVFSITVADVFDSVTNEYTLAKGKFPLFIDTGKNAVGINDFPAEGEALRVAEGVAHFIDGVKIDGYPVADYPVEIGTDGIWTYEKWASGKAVCWGATDTKKIDVDDAYGMGFYNSTPESASFPDGLFVAPPSNISVQNYATLGIIGCYIHNLTKDAVDFFVSSFVSVNLDLRFTIRAVGTWK